MRIKNSYDILTSYITASYIVSLREVLGLDGKNMTTHRIIITPNGGERQDNQDSQNRHSIKSQNAKRSFKHANPVVETGVAWEAVDN